MSLLGLGLLGFATQKRSEYISGIEGQQFIRFPTRFSISSSDGEVLKQVKVSSGILWAMFQKSDSKVQPLGKGGLDDAGSLFQVRISMTLGKHRCIISSFNLH